MNLDAPQRIMNLPRTSSARNGKYSAFEIVADSSRNRREWLNARNSGIGASEAATVFGLNVYQSPYTLYQLKRHEIPEQSDTEPMEWGRRLEGVIAEAYCEKTHREVWKHPLGGMLLRSREFPWLLATPDFEQRASRSRDDGLLEIKTAGAQYLADWSEDAPLGYQVQCQQQMLVSDRRYNSIAALIGGQAFTFKHFRRNEIFLKQLVKRTRKFWDMVQSGEPPEIDSSDSTIATLKQMREDGRAITLPKDVLKWHDQALAAAERRLAAEKEEKEAKAEIAAALGTASRGILSNGEGMYKFETRAGYRVKAHVVAPSRQLKFSKRVDV